MTAELRYKQTGLTVRDLCVKLNDQKRPIELRLRVAKELEPAQQKWSVFKIDDDCARDHLDKTLRNTSRCHDA